MDTEKSNLITEQLLQAMDIIANKKIENLPFDKTILCTITAIKDKDEGIYEVSANTDSAQANRSYFQAFAQEGATYEVGDNVYVNVPQNDFSNQKTIISKYISEQAKPVNYINPMEQFIKLEGINYTKKPNYGLKANSETQFQYKIFEKNYDLAHMPKNYDCLGISADFTTLLGSYKPLDGEYGLRFEFGGLKDGWDTNISDDTDISNISKYLALKEVTFSNKEMYGMTYDFFTPSHQEKLINLQDFPYPIKIVRCYFYQNKNFIDINNNKIPGEDYAWDELNKTWKKPIPTEDGEEQKYIVVDPDIQMDNLVCTFGYLMSDAKDGDLRLYTTSKIKYSEAKSENQNKKTLKLRWLLNDEDGNLKAIDELEDKVPEDDLTDYSWWENKIIYLYKYTYGKDEVDPYAGPFWERIASYGKYIATQTIREVKLDNGKYKYKPESRLLQIFSSSRDPWGNVDILNKGVSKFDKPFNIEVDITREDKDSVFARYKVIILEYTNPIVKNAANNPYTTSIQFDEEASDVVIGPEDVITEGNYRIIDETSLKIYESNEITFENENEVAGRAAMALINGLELECVDGSNGIYRIYGEDNKITAQTNSQSMKLRANFNAINILGLDAGEANITWYYPKTNTMFVSPIDKTKAKIDVYKIVFDPLDTENLNQYYVKVDEQYYQLKNIAIDESTAIGYTRNEHDYIRANSQAVYLKEQETISAANWDEDSDYYILKQQLDIPQIGDSDDVIPSNNEIVYTIDSFYASNRTNNTIKCKIERYGREYWAEKEFFFGHQGNNGTNYAFDISLEREYGTSDIPSSNSTNSNIVPYLKIIRNEQGQTNTNNNPWIKIKPTLIYGQEEITDNDILSKIRWSLYAKTSTGSGSAPSIIFYNEDSTILDNTTGAQAFIKLNTSNIGVYNNPQPGDKLGDSIIVKAELSKQVTFKNSETTRNEEGTSEQIKNVTRDITLTAYLPIAIADFYAVNGGVYIPLNIQTYEGGTSILYNNYGTDPIYYEGEHKLLDNNQNKISNILWRIFNNDTTNGNEKINYYPQMVQSKIYNNGIYQSIDEWMLKPTSMFFSGLVKEISIQAILNNRIIYSQPILIEQNAYGNQTINQWDGSLKIDEENNYILSAMLGAGKKDNYNKFSGVLLGDVGTSESSSLTGIYGYGAGVQTYGFREDGTAFIGASGKGRINFDGTNATITSGNYSNASGMQIDLDDGKIDAYNFTLTAGSSNEQIIITSNNHKTGGKYDENPLTIGSKFSVAWDGTVTMSQAQIGGDWSGTGYASSSSKTIESILQALATNAKNADDATNAVVNDHWEPDNLYSRFIEWPDQQFIQQKNSNGENLYWQSNYINSSYYSTNSSDYPYIERDTSNNETWKTSDGKHLYFQLSPSSSNTQTTSNEYPVVKENEAYTHFVLTNRTYGDATHEYILKKDGSLFAKNGIFSGLISAYAGDLGGWVISPGLMSYGYKMKLIQNNNNYYWQGDFFGNNTSNAIINADPDEIGGASNDNNKTTGINDDLTNITSSVSVDTSRAFIYLRNSGNGIGITKFANKSVPSTGVTQNASYFLSTNTEKSQPEYGRLKNIIFSLGQNFAVDKDGNLYTSSGYFSGEIQSTKGKIGGWSIGASDLEAMTRDENNKQVYWYTNLNASGSRISLISSENPPSNDATLTDIGNFLKRTSFISENGGYDENGDIIRDDIGIYGPGRIFLLNKDASTLSDVTLITYNSIYTPGTIVSKTDIIISNNILGLNPSIKLSQDGSISATSLSLTSDASMSNLTCTGELKLASIKNIIAAGGLSANQNMGVLAIAKNARSDNYQQSIDIIPEMDGVASTGWNQCKISSEGIQYYNSWPSDYVTSSTLSNYVLSNSLGGLAYQSLNTTQNASGLLTYTANTGITVQGNSQTNNPQSSGYSQCPYYEGYYYYYDSNSDHLYSLLSNAYYYWGGTYSGGTYNKYVMDHHIFFSTGQEVYGAGSSRKNTSCAITKHDSSNMCIGAFERILCNDLYIEGSKVSLTHPIYDTNASFGRVDCDSLFIGGTRCALLSEGYGDFSDLRLKQNLQQIINLDLYDNLIPYSFEWKKDSKKSYGFIAQDIEKLSQKYENNSDTLYYKIDNEHPEYINDDQEYRINYQQFHALHVAKNHQQDARIQSLESEVASLRAELEQLKREKGGQ